MNDEKQIIAIAESQNLVRCDQCGSEKGCGLWHEKDQPWRSATSLPDYLNDLNAMHELWLKLPPSKKDSFESHLYGVIVGDADYNRNDDAPYITNATARQRAEAYLKTIDKWEE